MLIRKRQVTILPSVCIAKDQIKKVTTVKYLKVFIDDRLKFQPQIEHIENTRSHFCEISYRLQNHFNLDAARIFLVSKI